MGHYTTCEHCGLTEKSYTLSCDCHSRELKLIVKSRIGSTLIDSFSVDDFMSTSIYEKWQNKDGQIFCTLTYMSEDIQMGRNGIFSIDEDHYDAAKEAETDNIETKECDALSDEKIANAYLDIQLLEYKLKDPRLTNVEQKEVRKEIETIRQQLSEDQFEESIVIKGFKIKVTNIPYSTSLEQLRKRFQGCGQIIQAEIVCDKWTGKPKGYGSITFLHEKDAKDLKYKYYSPDGKFNAFC